MSILDVKETICFLLESFYPVGSYYETSDTSFDPNIMWGGTWVLEDGGLAHIGSGTVYNAVVNPVVADIATYYELVDGEYVLTSDTAIDATKTYYTATTYAVGDIGGEATHTLSLDEMPSHNHNSRTLTGSTHTVFSGGQSTTTSGIVKHAYSGGRQYKTDGTGTNSWATITVTATHTHDSQGGGESHNNMQPYIVVNRWHRTA